MANKKWDEKWQDLKAKTFLALVAFLILGVVSWISGESDPVDAVWWGFWAVVWIVGSFSILCFIYISIREMKKRK
jgi:Na+/melibiose symporter-like transporter